MSNKQSIDLSDLGVIRLSDYFPGIDEALDEAILKHGLQSDISIYKQLAIMAEEFGEVNQDVLDSDYPDVDTQAKKLHLKHAKIEAYQLAAMVVKLIYMLDQELLKPIKEG